MMNTFSVAMRTAVFATGFLWLWTWIANLLRPLDAMFGGPLPPWARTAAVPVMLIGGAIGFWCVASFVVLGKGTPAPFDAPRRLVARGPYRHVRNPMYIGGALLLCGFGLYQQSPAIVAFVAPWWLLFHLFVIFYEERRLHRQFDGDYDEYCRTTPRWIPR